MKDTDYSSLLEFIPTGGGMLPVNQPAKDLIDNASTGEVFTFQECSSRDILFHRAYFSLINYIYDWLPIAFKKKIPKDTFYKFVKHLRKEYDVLFTFADGSQIVEYQSISFGRMSQAKFKEYVKDQLPFIYGDVIQVLYPDKKDSDRIIASIEAKYERFLMKL